MSIPSSGSSTCFSASYTSSFVGISFSSVATALVAEQPDFLPPLSCEEVDPVGEAHPVAARAHDQGMGPRRVGVEADASQEVAVGDPRGRDDHLARRELLGREDAGGVLDPGLARLLDLPTRGRPELRLELAPEAAQRR